MSKHVFLTGPPGVGKTTLIQKVTQALKSSGISIDGFYTEEVREGGRRTGFDVVTLSGKRGPLSRVSSDSSTSRREYRVGQYVVDLVSFEQLVLPMLRNVNHGSDAEKKICVIDEIGKMELFSQPFIQAVRQTLTGSGTMVLGTIPIPKGKPLDLVEEIRSRKDVKVFNYRYWEICSFWESCLHRKSRDLKKRLISIKQPLSNSCESFPALGIFSLLLSLDFWHVG
ncbi:cancer-related nucleoside-triphosphatase isoform X2 [Buteo buteo]|uniref:cancer-related nucleoside-triphosphatase isoform X2 n=1 Tax=Buteo buteo TaxID=30397 RepID=UPI003EBF22D1